MLTGGTRDLARDREVLNRRSAGDRDVSNRLMARCEAPSFVRKGEYMKLTFVTALKNAKNGAMRVVFTAPGNLAVVLKTFGPEAPADLRSVKVWSLGSSSLQKTMSYWSTTESVTLSELSIDVAKEDIRRVLGAAIGRAS